MKNLLKKWYDINNNEYVLIDTKGNKLNQVKLNQRLNKIFDMKISVNALRHSYLTNKYGEEWIEYDPLSFSVDKVANENIDKVLALQNFL
jgi:hypothetical protein